MKRLFNYKERFIDILNEMVEDERAGLIPSMIAEGLKESKADDGTLAYWVIDAVKRLDTEQITK